VSSGGSCQAPPFFAKFAADWASLVSPILQYFIGEVVTRQNLFHMLKPLIAASVVLLSLPLFGQGVGSAPGTISVRASAEGRIRLGDLSNVMSFGIGGLAVRSYDIDQNLAANVKAGHLRFSNVQFDFPVQAAFAFIPKLNKSTHLQSLLVTCASIAGVNLEV